MELSAVYVHLGDVDDRRLAGAGRGEVVREAEVLPGFASGPRPLAWYVGRPAAAHVGPGAHCPAHHANKDLIRSGATEGSRGAPTVSNPRTFPRRPRAVRPSCAGSRR